MHHPVHLPGANTGLGRAEHLICPDCWASPTPSLWRRFHNPIDLAARKFFLLFSLNPCSQIHPFPPILTPVYHTHYFPSVFGVFPQPIYKQNYILSTLLSLTESVPPALSSLLGTGTCSWTSQEQHCEADLRDS